MYDESPEGGAVFYFDELASHLLDQGVEAAPSQLHGCLSGLLAAGAAVEAEYGLDALSRALDIDIYGELASRVLQLYSVTAGALQGDDSLFLPLLPDEDDDIAVRTAALAEWCKGFLSGFAFQVAAQEQVGSALPKDTAEVLKDIVAMAEATVDDEADAEDGDKSYQELVEYLRVAVTNVYYDCRAEDSNGSKDLHKRPLH